MLALRQFGHHRRLSASLVRALTDPRCAKKVDHPLASLLRQRLYQIVAGYEDANDADRLRHDPTFQLLADRSVGEPLASQPTLSRWENAFSRRDWVRWNRLLLDWFCHLCSAQVRARSAQIETLRTRVFKLGARIGQTARRVWVHFASGWPFQSLFVEVCGALDTS